MPRQAPSCKLLLAASCASLLSAGCATLPQAGPTGRKIEHAGANGAFSVIEVNGVGAIPKGPYSPEQMPFPPKPVAELQAIAPGDVISVIFYEVGVRVFAGGPSAPGAAFDPAAKNETVGPIEVDQAGTIRLPYAGVLEAAGRTPRELAEDIEARLRGKSENPQVMVRLDAANGSGVMVAGEAVRPGRVRLSAAHEKLLDVITLAGGAREPQANVLVRVRRGEAVIEVPVEDLTFSNLGGMTMEPGDRIELVRKNRSYTMMGSANRVSRFDLPLRRFSLSEAMALAGGPSENLANPGAVFVFRYEKVAAKGPVGAAPDERPVVYHLNMMKPASYFLAQQFYVTDKDVVYVGGAEANQPTKLIQILGQLFTPIALTRTITQ